MKFYMTPGSCSTGIHILLEEIEAAFEVYLVNLMAGDHLKADFVALNPKSTIPVLVRNDGSALTEFQAIAWWLARTYPRAKLVPEDAEGQARVIELMDYAVGTLHGQAFARLFTPSQFAQSEAEHEAVQAQGRERTARGLEVLDRALPSDGYAVGDFSIADAAIFYVEFWADKVKLPLPPNCAAHYRTMLGRAAVQRVLREEGYRVP